MVEKFGYAHVLEAAERIAPHIHRTPVLTSRAINEMAGAEIFFKCENFQRIGAFKFRGACNAVFSLDETALGNGVLTHSSGNHGAALSLAASMRGVHAHVVMPKNTTAVKRAAVAGYGANIIDCEPTMESREGTLAQVKEQTSAYVVHPYNDYAVMAGQGTAALELLQEISGIDIVFTPVGGGGLLSGSSVVARALFSGVRVYGVEPAGADDAKRSFDAGKVVSDTKPDTIAEGLRATIGDKTLAVIRENVDDIITVDDSAIIRAMRIIWERLKIIVEPSAAIVLAPLLEDGIKHHGSRIGVILTGGNVDLENLPWMKRD